MSRALQNDWKMKRKKPTMRELWFYLQLNCCRSALCTEPSTRLKGPLHMCELTVIKCDFYKGRLKMYMAPDSAKSFICTIFFLNNRNPQMSGSFVRLLTSLFLGAKCNLLTTSDPHGWRSWDLHEFRVLLQPSCHLSDRHNEWWQVLILPKSSSVQNISLQNVNNCVQTRSFHIKSEL